MSDSEYLFSLIKGLREDLGKAEGRIRELEGQMAADAGTTDQHFKSLEERVDAEFRRVWRAQHSHGGAA